MRFNVHLIKLCFNQPRGLEFLWSDEFKMHSRIRVGSGSCHICQRNLHSGVEVEKEIAVPSVL
jgi:hypothetical protein